MENPSCPLCSNASTIFYDKAPRVYFECKGCHGIFLHSSFVPDAESEKARYLEHNNDTQDPGYRNFVSPITQAVLNQCNPSQKGLDYGAGTAPVISAMLLEKGFNIVQYDPFFHPFPELLHVQYDYIVCCEVIEHFHYPQKSFTELKKMLLPGGKLFCMTDIYNPSINFHTWYYKNDQTHVFIYQEETLVYIREKMGFGQMDIAGRLITYTL